MSNENGRLPSTGLAFVGGAQVALEVAADLQAMCDAYAAHFGQSLDITSGYRSYEKQESLFRERYQTKKIPGALTKRWLGLTWYKKPGVAIAAAPGTSVHGWGLAVDLNSADVNSAAEKAWLKANGHGWVWPTWAQNAATFEPWHYEHAKVVARPVVDLRRARIRSVTGPGVVDLKAQLKARGYRGMDASNRAGIGTRAALLKFQKDAGLTPDAICGPLTWAALLN